MKKRRNDSFVGVSVKEDTESKYPETVEINCFRQNQIKQKNLSLDEWMIHFGWMPLIIKDDDKRTEQANEARQVLFWIFFFIPFSSSRRWINCSWLHPKKMMQERRRRRCKTKQILNNRNERSHEIYKIPEISVCNPSAWHRVKY